MKTFFFSLFLLALAPAATLAFSTAPVGPAPAEGESGFAVRADAGMLHGNARERVYSYGDLATGIEDGRRRQLSRLDWDMDNVPMIGAVGSYWIRRNLSLNLGLWFALDSTDDDGYMKDYDWMAGSDVHYSDYSESTSDLTSGTIADLNFEYDFVTDWNNVVAGLFAGVRYEQWKWEANDGFALYSELNYIPYPFEGVVCKYRQEYSTSYIGLRTAWSVGAFTLSAYGAWGTFYAEDRDDHLMAGKLFKDEADDYKADYFSCGLSASFAFAENLTASIGWDYTYYGNSIGDLKLWDEEEGYDKGDDCGGLSLRHHTFSASLAYRF